MSEKTAADLKKCRADNSLLYRTGELCMAARQELQKRLAAKDTEVYRLERDSAEWERRAMAAEHQQTQLLALVQKDEAKIERLTEALQKCMVEIDSYIDQEYPPDAHPLYERKNRWAKKANPAREALGWR